MTHSTEKHARSGILLLALGALGVVYGDIGTSPLYAVNEIFFGHALPHYTHADILGAISLVFWALTLVVAIKYVFFVLRADSDGEGGVFALYNLISNLPKSNVAITGLLIIAAGLLYGDGMITPAISVISAVEGLKMITRSFEPYIVPITIVILTGLFSIQNKGTAKVGAIFGPIMMLWFIAIGGIGLFWTFANPAILAIVNPLHAITFLLTHEFHTILLTLGSVMLVITGGEAMYADMGHFGRLPIRIGWYAVAYPALIANYLGQGAYLLSGKAVLESNVFYSMVPAPLLLPMVILATIATVIASQALISGAFSLTMQAISLRLLPYLPIKHTHNDHEGQIYIAHINWAIYIGAVALVFGFGSSVRLAGAYGLAVAGVMFVTTLGMILIAKNLWNWKPWIVYAVFIPFACLDGLFLFANSLKFFEGGFIPLTIGLLIFAIIQIWQWGRRHTAKAFQEFPCMTVSELIKIQQRTDHDLPRTMVFLNRYPITSLTERVPIQMQLFWEKNAALPEHLVFLTVETVKKPHADKRFFVQQLTPVDQKTGTITSIIVQYGFMETPYLEPLIKRFIAHKDIPSNDPIEHWVMQILHEKLVAPKYKTVMCTVKFGLYAFLHKLINSSDHYFGLGENIHLTVDILPVTLK